MFYLWVLAQYHLDKNEKGFLPKECEGCEDIIHAHTIHTFISFVFTHFRMSVWLRTIRV